MGFVTNISDFGSLAIVGLEKNTGKTECLNYILGQLGGQAERFALTSVGIDGESRDQVCQTAKPEIEIPEGMIFVTSEKHYREKRLAAEVLDVSLERTALGRLITARARMSGKLLLSGPSDTAGLKALIDRLKARGVGTTIVDGALSRYISLENLYLTPDGKIGGLPEKAANLINKTKDNAKIERIKDALINIIGHNRTSGDLGILIESGTSYRFKSIFRRILTLKQIVCRTKSCLHDTSCYTKNYTCSCSILHRPVTFYI